MLARCFQLALVALSVTVLGTAVRSQSLTTTYADDNFQDGNMFDLVAGVPLTVDTIDVHFADSLNPAPCGGTCSVVEVEVYTTPGGYSGKQGDPSLWTQVGTVQHTVTTGAGVAQPLALPLNVCIDPSNLPGFPSRMGVYVTNTGNTNSVTAEQNENILYTAGANTYSNSELTIETGLGIEYPFATFFTDRTWNGTAHYTTRDESLATTYAGGNFQDGNMFNLRAQRALTLTTLDVHFSDSNNPAPCGGSCSVTEVEVYASEGGYVGKETTPGAWTLLGTVQHTITTAPGTPQALALPLNLAMDPADTASAPKKYGLYVTNTGATNSVTAETNEKILYTDGSSTLDNGDLVFVEGTGNQYPFGSYFANRIWNGTVHYSPKLPSLETTFEDGNFQDGNMFNVTATSALTVHTFDVHFSDSLNPAPCGMTCSVTEVEVYASEGGYVGKQNDPSAWMKLGSVQHTISTGSGSPQPLGLPITLSMDPTGAVAPNKYGFYVTNTGLTNAVTAEQNQKILYTNGASTYSNADLTITSGLGNQYPFASFFNNRTWNGRVNYSCSIGSDVTRYCTAGTSASGCQATMWAAGTASATAPSGFTVNASGVEGNKFGLFFYGVNGRRLNVWGGGSSFVCVEPPFVRTPNLDLGGTNGNCDGSPTLDLNALWCSTCPLPAKNPGAGTQVNLQLWYRDPFNTQGFGPGKTTSMSDGLEFQVVP